MREKVTHPATPRELTKALRIPQEERATFRRLLKALVTTGELVRDQRRPRWLARQDGPRRRPPADARGGLWLRHSRQGRRRCAQTCTCRRRTSKKRCTATACSRGSSAGRSRTGSRGASSASSSAAIRRSSAASTWTSSGLGFVQPFDRRVADRCACADRSMGRGRAGRDGGRGDHDMAHRVARAGREGRRSARRHQRARGRHRDHHPQIRHSRRAWRSSHRGGARASDLSAPRTSRGAPISARPSR